MGADRSPCCNRCFQTLEPMAAEKDLLAMNHLSHLVSEQTELEQCMHVRMHMYMHVRIDIIQDSEYVK